jgi:hypothetical protein
MSTLLRPDILIQNPATGPVAIVEIKNRRELPSAVAAEIHQMLLDQGYRIQPLYFLLLSQDRGFLWKDAHNGVPVSPPQEFDMRNVVARYLPDLAPTERLREAELSLIIIQWLTDLAEGWQNHNHEPEHTLAATGFLEDVLDADITAEPQW